MLRTITNMIMASLLLFSTMGFAISEHYCENELISVNLKAETEPCCDDGGMCCDTETRFLQLDDDFLADSSISHFKNLFSTDYLLTSSEVKLQSPEAGSITSFNYSYLPPRGTSTRLALHQVYRL